MRNVRLLPPRQCFSALLKGTSSSAFSAGKTQLVAEIVPFNKENVAERLQRSAQRGGRTFVEQHAHRRCRVHHRGHAVVTEAMQIKQIGQMYQTRAYVRTTSKEQRKRSPDIILLLLRSRSRHSEICQQKDHIRSPEMPPAYTASFSRL